MNYKLWNKFLSLHELNQEQLNDKVYLQSLYENTIHDFHHTIKTLNDNNIPYTIETDELNLDTILI